MKENRQMEKTEWRKQNEEKQNRENRMEKTEWRKQNGENRMEKTEWRKQNCKDRFDVIGEVMKNQIVKMYFGTHLAMA